jgi:sugar O-acyltransferase (sialic acid O-acetyltransferase NeuD family)
MRDAVMIGGGGHAMSCLDAADGADVRFVGYVSPAPDPRLPLDHLGGDDALPGLQERFGLAFVAVGDNRRRAALSATITGLGFELATLVAGTARVSPHASIGPGAAVLHHAFVGPRSRVDTGAIVNTAASADHDCTIGEFAHIAPGTHLAGGVTIGPGAFAGVGVSVVPDVRIGAWSVVGAGAVVIDQVAAESTVMGVPARTRSTS